MAPRHTGGKASTAVRLLMQGLLHEQRPQGEFHTTVLRPSLWSGVRGNRLCFPSPVETELSYWYLLGDQKGLDGLRPPV